MDDLTGFPETRIRRRHVAATNRNGVVTVNHARKCNNIENSSLRDGCLVDIITAPIHVVFQPHRASCTDAGHTREIPADGSTSDVGRHAVLCGSFC